MIRDVARECRRTRETEFAESLRPGPDPGSHSGSNPGRPSSNVGGMNASKRGSSGTRSPNGVLNGVAIGVEPGSGSAAMNAPPQGVLPTAPVLTIEEASAVLRISRTLAYQLAAEYQGSGGMSGLPCLRIAGCLRVPRWALLELALAGRVVRLCDADVSAVVSARSSAEDGFED